MWQVGNWANSLFLNYVYSPKYLGTEPQSSFLMILTF